MRHGHAPERLAQTGIGPVPVRRAKVRDPKVRDRGAGGGGGRIRLTSAIPPRRARRTRSLDAPPPVPYLRGVSTGGLREAPGAPLGEDAPNLPPAVSARLRGGWGADHARRRRRDLSARRHVHPRADGVHLQARMEPQAERMVAPVGATPEGRKELAGFRAGVREGARSWRGLPVDPEARGLAAAPEPATGDGALGFWTALEAVFPAARHRRCRVRRHQRCRVHEASGVPDKLPRSVQPAAKADLRETRRAPDRAAAEAATATSAEKHGTKCGKAVACLAKDREALLAFHDLPAERRDHLRTADPIEGVFATVRHRTVRTEGAPSQGTARPMVSRLVMAAAKTWRRPHGQSQLPKATQGVTFRDGVEVTDTPEQTAARSRRHPDSRIARATGPPLGSAASPASPLLP